MNPLINGIEAISFDDFSEIVNSCNSNVAQYLNLINKIGKNFNLFFESYIFEQTKNRIGLIGLKEIKKMLNYQDMRSVMNWCKTNKVVIIKQGNAQLVNSTQFTLAFYKPFIAQLKSKSENWLEEFELFLKGQFRELLIDKNTSKGNSDYKPTSGVEKSFLDKMKNL